MLDTLPLSNWWHRRTENWPTINTVWMWNRLNAECNGTFLYMYLFQLCLTGCEVYEVWSVKWYGFYHATACNAMHSIAVAVLSVHPSVRCMYCDKTKWCTVDIVIPHETAITLVIWHQHWLVGDVPFPLKPALKLTHPLRKTPTLTHLHLFPLSQP